MAVHHRRRLRNLGHAARIDPPADGAPVGRRRPAAAARATRSRCSSTARRRCPRSSARSAARAATSTSPAGRSRRTSPLTRDEPPVVLRELLADTAERVDVRVLMWAGAPPHTFAPDRATVRDARDELTRGTQGARRVRRALARAALPPREARDRRRRGRVRRRHRPDPARRRPLRHERPPGARPARLARRELAPARPGGRRRRGALRRSLERGHAATPVAGAARAPPAPAGDVEVQVVRTLPERQYDFVPRRRLPHPRGLRPRAALGRAARVPREPVPLGARGRRRARGASCATRRTTTSASSSSCPRARTTARRTPAASSRSSPTPTRGARRFLAATISARTGRTVDRLYVHAKIGIVDDRWLTIGSANLNAHSLFNDSEMNVVTCDPALARDTRLRLWAEHLERDAADVAGDPAAVVDELWRPIACRAARARPPRRPAHAPAASSCRPPSRHLDRLLAPLDALVVDG